MRVPGLGDSDEDDSDEEGGSVGSDNGEMGDTDQGEMSDDDSDMGDEQAEGLYVIAMYSLELHRCLIKSQLGHIWTHSRATKMNLDSVTAIGELTLFGEDYW